MNTQRQVELQRAAEEFVSLQLPRLHDATVNVVHAPGASAADDEMAFFGRAVVRTLSQRIEGAAAERAELVRAAHTD